MIQNCYGNYFVLQARQEENATVTGCPVVTKFAQKLRDIDSGNNMSLGHPRNVEDRLLDYEERKKTKLKQVRYYYDRYWAYVP